jgi:hypothetical protein
MPMSSPKPSDKRPKTPDIMPSSSFLHGITRTRIVQAGWMGILLELCRIDGHRWRYAVPRRAFGRARSYWIKLKVHQLLLLYLQ